VYRSGGVADGVPVPMHALDNPESMLTSSVTAMLPF
jgi:hypothetical protein